LKRSTFSALEGVELDLALKAIRRAGLTQEDFTLEERRTQSFANGGVHVHKLISVTRVSNGKQRQYSTGRGGGWPFEFERDLQCGFFASEWPSQPGISGGAEAR
jgi:hypothetical protein